MVRLRERVVNGIPYYYLEHSIRENGRVVKKEKYLGRRIPKEIERVRREFLTEVSMRKWFDLFDRIRRRYAKENQGMPFSARQKEMGGFGVRFTYNTQRIEGSRLTFRETARLLEEGATPSEKPLNDALEAEAHNRVFLDTLRLKKDLSLPMVLDWHRRLFAQTKPDVAGKIRKHQVTISGSRFVPPTPVEVYPLLRDFFRWYDREKGRTHAVELAALVHLRFVTVHPFADGNGRISRLMMNFVLYRLGYPMLDIPYAKRGSYYNALERSQVRRDDSPFVNWFFRRYLKEYERYSTEPA